MPDIFGTTGNDVLTGTGASERIDSAWGDDQVDAGGGDDTITDDGGNNVIRGGAGNDMIDIRVVPLFRSALETSSFDNLIDAGDGDDVVSIYRFSSGALTVLLGSGNDSVRLSTSFAGAGGTITTGAGSDRIILNADYEGQFFPGTPNTLVVTDFSAGAGGDVLDLGELFVRYRNSSTSIAANPFASGHLRLVQSGADTVLRYDFDGNGSDTGGGDLVVLQNVVASSLVAENLAGFSPAGSALPAEGRNGTIGADWLRANAGGGSLDGLDGNDTLIGNAGADQLVGGAGNDILDGGWGTDILRGGDGDDVLIDTLGAPSGGALGTNVFDGGAGNDRIDVIEPQFMAFISIDAGAGNDLVRLIAGRGSSSLATIALGDGDDRLVINQAATITLGGGSDRIETAAAGLRINDFSAGNGGDILDVVDYAVASTGWDRVSNLFASGHLLVQQSGADTLVLFDQDGAGTAHQPTELARLLHVQASMLTAFNFAGFDPSGAPSTYTIGPATAGDDYLRGSNGVDTIDGGAGNDYILEDRYGSDTLIGGLGDDTIVVRSRPDYRPDAVTILAGEGNDLVEYARGETSRPTIDLGAGDDRLILFPPEAGSTVTTGAGRDTIVVPVSAAVTATGPIVITDFATGDQGDRLDWSSYIRFEALSHAVDFNPFVTGAARIIQSGADAILQIDLVASSTPGHVPIYINFVTFRGANAGDFTVYNLGFETFLDTQTGTAGDDVISGREVRDTISGLAGNDRIDGLGGDDLLRGNDGDDVLNGGAGRDTLDGGLGADTLNGGDDADLLHGGRGRDLVNGEGGDDVITDDGGSDVISGGDGADQINVRLDQFAIISLNEGLGSIEAGAGNDVVVIDDVNYLAQGYRVSLGDGDDRVRFGRPGIELRLGEGRDIVEYDSGSYTTTAVVIEDFAAGTGGDVFDLRTYLTGTFQPYSFVAPAIATVTDNGANPFAFFASISQFGNDVLLIHLPARLRGRWWGAFAGAVP